MIQGTTGIFSRQYHISWSHHNHIYEPHSVPTVIGSVFVNHTWLPAEASRSLEQGPQRCWGTKVIMMMCPSSGRSLACFDPTQFVNVFGMSTYITAGELWVAGSRLSWKDQHDNCCVVSPCSHLPSVSRLFWSDAAVSVASTGWSKSSVSGSDQFGTQTCLVRWQHNTMSHHATLRYHLYQSNISSLWFILVYDHYSSWSFFESVYSIFS